MLAGEQVCTYVFLSLGTLTAGIGKIQSKAAEGVQSKRSFSTDSASETQPCV